MELYSSHYTNKNILNDTKPIIKKILSNNTIILCIGSDKIILDCLGPLVGTILKNNSNLNILGDLSNPITTKNLNSVTSELDKTTNNVIVIDCCLSEDKNNINNIYIYNKPSLPGGLNTNKTPIGNYKILACVDHLNNPLIYSNNKSLFHVYNLAQTIANILMNGINDNEN